MKGYSPFQERVFVAGGRLPDSLKNFGIFEDLIKCEFERDKSIHFKNSKHHASLTYNHTTNLLALSHH